MWLYLRFIPGENDEAAVLAHNKKERQATPQTLQTVTLAAPSEGEAAALAFLDLSLGSLWSLQFCSKDREEKVHRCCYGDVDCSFR